MDLHILFFYLVPQYVTERQKSNIFEFHKILDTPTFFYRHSVPTTMIKRSFAETLNRQSRV
jgi:hypothetical protein